MDRAELRALQAPVKDRYRADPEAAVTRFCVVGRSLAEPPEFVIVRAAR